MGRDRAERDHVHSADRKLFPAMMFAYVNDQKRLASPDQRGQCPACRAELLAKCGSIRTWHWSHIADDEDCDSWAESELEWHLGWKGHVPSDRAEVVMTRNGKTHRADILAANGAVLELQASSILPPEIQERESFYKHMAWLYRVTWTDRLHYGPKGFWWKQGSIAQTFITKPLFWEFEDEGLVQQIKLTRADRPNSYGNPVGNRILGHAVKTYTKKQFVDFVTMGTAPNGPAPIYPKRELRCFCCRGVIEDRSAVGKICVRCIETDAEDTGPLPPIYLKGRQCFGCRGVVEDHVAVGNHCDACDEAEFATVTSIR